MQSNQQQSIPPAGPGGPPQQGPGGRGGRGGRGGFGPMARPPIPPEYQAEPILALPEAKLIDILKNPASTPFQINVACKKLAQTGTKDAIPALAALLGSEQSSHMARFALEPMPDPAADDVLRAALPKLKGRLLVGVVNSIGARGDTKAVEPLSRLMLGSDVAVAMASAEALGRISGPAAAKVLHDGLTRTKGDVRAVVADAGLVCAEGLLAQGDRARAMALYDGLTRPDIPKPVRLAAMHSVIAAETSLGRERVPPPPEKK